MNIKNGGSFNYRSKITTDVQRALYNNRNSTFFYIGNNGSPVPPPPPTQYSYLKTNTNGYVLTPNGDKIRVNYP